MSKCSMNDVDNYKSGGGSFFKLENDGDTARVRFMFNSIDDLDFDVVHEVEVGDKKRLVSCLRTYSDPVDDCPLCAAGYRPTPKLFVPMYNEDTGEAQLWQRSRNFPKQISGICRNFSPLTSVSVEIQRNGKKGDKNTVYSFTPIGGQDDTTLDDLPEVPIALGTVVLDKDFDELSKFIEKGFFEDDSKPIERRAAPVNRANDSATPTRRVPTRKF